jgi:hypothetical protein
MVMDDHIATIWFIDGVWRAVLEEADGRQYVIDGDGVKVYGVWHYSRGEPTPTVVIDLRAHR